jgi:uncharacterized protein YgbK (DUF1537 family)
VASFKVKTPIRKDGEDYAPGEIIQLSAKEAATMPHAVEALPEAKPAASTAPDLSKMTKQQLVEYAQEKLGLTLDVNSTKDELLAAIAEKSK